MRVRYVLGPLLLLAGSLRAATIVPGTLFATLQTGTLAGVSFPVSFSYDASQATPTGTSFVTLTTFDFTLLGSRFTAPTSSRAARRFW